MINRIIKFFLISVVSVVLTSTNAGSTPTQAVFKIPDGFMQAPTEEFKGTLLLDEQKPAGVFLTYPNNNESTEKLTKRLLDYVVPMFIHDKDTEEESLVWNTKPLPVHAGAGRASLNLYKEGDLEIQVALYEVSTHRGPFLYGYFAMRHIPATTDDAKFLDEKGKGVKVFDKFWRSIKK